eukprot:scaffold191483_cov40-Tisochrysis_lutea.AAC.2
MESARRVLCAIIALLVCAPEGALSLQLGAAPLARPYIAPRALTPIAQFGGDEPPRGLSRDSEPEEFFKTNMGEYIHAPPSGKTLCPL